MHVCTTFESSIRIWAWGFVVAHYHILATRIVQGHIWEFDSAKETIEDFHQRFEFYCKANNIKSEDEAQLAHKKSSVHHHVGVDGLHEVAWFWQVPMTFQTLTLNQIIEILTIHYWLQTIEIAERYKFFKDTQGDQETHYWIYCSLEAASKDL